MKADLFRTIYDQFTMSPNSLGAVKQRHHDIKEDTLEAIFRRRFQIETIKNMGRLMRTKSPEAVLETCLSHDSAQTVANLYGLSVCALARFIMKPMYTLDKVTDYLRNPANIPHHHLAAILTREIDPEADLSHPNWDAKRRAHGERKEEQLKDLLRAHQIPCFDEADLRKFGYPKTPDFKLPFPVGLNQEPVCWVESKALFGDDLAHAEYTKSQYQPYVSRFGPGAVVYWYGFVEELAGRVEGVQLFDGDTLVAALSTAAKIVPTC